MGKVNYFLRISDKFNIDRNFNIKLTFIHEPTYTLLPRVGEYVKIGNSKFKSWHDIAFSHYNNDEEFFNFCDIFESNDKYFHLQSEEYIVDKYNVSIIGRTDEIKERYYIISPERKLKHPAIVEIVNAATK